MNANKSNRFGLKRPAAVAVSALLVATAITAGAAEDSSRLLVMTVVGADGDDPALGTSGGSSGAHQDVMIRTIEPESAKVAGKVTWLGVSVEEVSAALGDQLGLKQGEGMVINFVSAESPASKAGLRKNDVLVAFDDQILVDPVQLRKLVQMRPDGDTVKITFYRAGKRQSAATRLAVRAWNEGTLGSGVLRDGNRNVRVRLTGLDGLKEGLDQQMKVLSESLDNAGLNRKDMQIEIENTVKQTRQAIQDAMKNAVDSREARKALGTVSEELAELAGNGVDVGTNTTVVVKSGPQPSRTVVQTDDTGSYVIIADPAKHLTAHDRNGRLLFDGPIESAEEQQKIPRDVWERVQPLLAGMDGRNLVIEQPRLHGDGADKNEP